MLLFYVSFIQNKKPYIQSHFSIIRKVTKKFITEVCEFFGKFFSNCLKFD